MATLKVRPSIDGYIEIFVNETGRKNQEIHGWKNVSLTMTKREVS